MINIGVVGYSSDDFNKNIAKALLSIAFDIIESENNSSDFAVVSGFSDLGISGIAYRLADKREWKTVGFSAEEVKKYDRYDVDEEIIEGKHFGDESKKFIEYIDCLVRVGGGDQSLKEVEMANKKGIPVYEYDLPEEK